MDRRSRSRINRHCRRDDCASVEGLMSREAYIRASVAIAATGLFPNTIRDAVISDAKFTEAFGLKADAIIRFGPDDLTFQRSAFFDTIRQAFVPSQQAVPVDNTQGETWETYTVKSMVK